VCNSTAVVSKSFRRQKQLSWHVCVCQSVNAGRLSTWSIPTRWAQKTIAGGQEAPAWVAAHSNQLSYQLCLCFPLHSRCILASHHESQHYFWSLPAFLTLLPLQVTLLVTQLLALKPFAVQLWRALSKQLKPCRRQSSSACAQAVPPSLHSLTNENHKPVSLAD
jgi:hypothetical protein